MTGIFIIARLGSTRLSQKHLIKAAGKTFIEWLVNRFLKEFENEIITGVVRIYITTSDADILNKKFEKIFANNKNLTVFYGSDDNIPLRQLQCANANAINNIISIDGDDILCSTKGARYVLDALTNGAERASTVNLPLGMNVAGYKTSVLQKILSTSKYLKLETGWGRIFESTITEKIFLGGEQSGLRMTLDYPEDSKFFQEVIEKLKHTILTISDEYLINFIIENKINQINGKLNDLYWRNFSEQKQQETIKTDNH